ncbi:tripartite tricarboxylate transporter TctB family protein [Labedella endophytica]|uniref:Tripartite tricarboxylate transporter TctB family protein n=1 Tax=Labedella endophytica TaxID=1523160 RepID=A0A3S1CS33_9MICO|nr:tripartite tricarboxylate transporter TctB family protein [Labedella endophytica]RUR01032.1 tripartite tricarboxylate transporter TctB family protein [Labedella endophytica]
MTFPPNPTAASAVIGDRLRLVSGPGLSALLKGLTMPVIVAAFATYLLVGILTMRVPAATDFPGPQFFPAIVAAGLYAFAALLAVSAIREIRALPQDYEEDLLAAENDDDAPAGRSVRVDVRSLAWVVGSFVGFALVLQVLGWVISASLLFWCVARGFGSDKPVNSLLVGLTMSSLAYIGFSMVLGLPLPSGILGGI